MKIKISNTLTLGEWFQLDNGRGHLVREWIRQDASKPQLKGMEHWGSDIERIYFYPNACDSTAVQFIGSLGVFKRTFEECTPEYTRDKGLLDWDHAEEIKSLIDNFLIKAAKIKIFI